jgi:L-malate glycosyltransferase
MKVLHLDSGLTWRGGQEQLLQLEAGLRRYGVEQQLVLHERGALARRLSTLDIPFQPLPLRFEVDLLSLLGLRQIIQRFQPDIVHAHDARTLGLIAAARVFSARPKVVAARRVAFPVRKNPFTWLKYRQVTNRIIAVSEFVRDVLLAGGIDPQRIAVVYDGIDWEKEKPSVTRVEARRRFGVAQEGYLIGCVGHFTPEKGHETLLRGFVKVASGFPQVQLILVGEGELKDHCVKCAQETGLIGRVVFPGFVPDIENIWPALDLFVFPSLEEGLGSTLLMAMGSIVPVCASRTGGIPEIVTHGETGYLFPPGDVDALSEALRLIIQNPERAQAWAMAAAPGIRRKFSAGRMVQETQQIYTNVLRC